MQMGAERFTARVQMVRGITRSKHREVGYRLMVRRAPDITLLFTVMCTLVRVVNITVVVAVANLRILVHQDRDTMNMPVMYMHTEKDRSLMRVLPIHMAAVIKIMYLMWAASLWEAGSIMAPLVIPRIPHRLAQTNITEVGLTLAQAKMVQVTTNLLRPLIVWMPDSLMGNSTLLNISRAVQT